MALSGLRAFLMPALIGLVLVSSCGTTTSDQLEFVQREIRQQHGDCEDKRPACASVYFEYPEFTRAANAAVLDSLNQEVQEYLLTPLLNEGEADTPERVIELFFQEFQQLLEDMPDYATQWTAERHVKVETDTLGILCLSFSEYAYTGGAHGISQLQFGNYDLRTGKRLALTDILNDGFHSWLNTVGEKKFRGLKQLKAEESLEQAGYIFDDANFSLNDNFAVRPQGLLFYFNSYEIASYAEGTTELLIPYSEIKELIRPDGVLARLAPK